MRRRKQRPETPAPRIAVRNNITETVNPAASRDLFRRILQAVEEEERERNGIPGTHPEKTEH